MIRSCITICVIHHVGWFSIFHYCIEVLTCEFLEPQFNQRPPDSLLAMWKRLTQQKNATNKTANLNFTIGLQSEFLLVLEKKGYKTRMVVFIGTRPSPC